MAILRFRSRRQRDTFAPAPLAAPVAAPRFADPHGIATDETLAGLAAQAQTATMARPPWGPWDRPGGFPEALNATAGHDLTVMDSPPRQDRPYIPGVLGSEGRLSPRTAGVADDIGSLLLFRAAVERMTRPGCEQCQQAEGTWQERLYATYSHHTRPVDGTAPRQFGIATELRQAHEGAAAAADRAERAFAERYLTARAA